MSRAKPVSEFETIKVRKGLRTEYKALAAAAPQPMQDFLRTLMDFYKRNSKKGKAPTL